MKRRTERVGSETSVSEDTRQQFGNTCWAEAIATSLRSTTMFFVLSRLYRSSQKDRKGEKNAKALIESNVFHGNVTFALRTFLIPRNDYTESRSAVDEDNQRAYIQDVHERVC